MLVAQISVKFGHKLLGMAKTRLLVWAFALLAAVQIATRSRDDTKEERRMFQKAEIIPIKDNRRAGSPTDTNRTQRPVKKSNQDPFRYLDNSKLPDVLRRANVYVSLLPVTMEELGAWKCNAAQFLTASLT